MDFPCSLWYTKKKIESQPKNFVLFLLHWLVHWVSHNIQFRCSLPQKKTIINHRMGPFNRYKPYKQGTVTPPYPLIFGHLQGPISPHLYCNCFSGTLRFSGSSAGGVQRISLCEAIVASSTTWWLGWRKDWAPTIVLNGTKWDPSKWPKITGDVTVTCRCYNPIYNWLEAHLVFLPAVFFEYIPRKAAIISAINGMVF